MKWRFSSSVPPTVSTLVHSWTLELLVRRQTGPVSGTFSSFELAYQLPEPYLERPVPTAEQLAAAEEASRPDAWLTLWYQKSVEISVLGVALLVLTAILFSQDSLARRPTLLHWLRRGYLVFTVVFLGGYALAQLHPGGQRADLRPRLVRRLSLGAVPHRSADIHSLGVHRRQHSAVGAWGVLRLAVSVRRVAGVDQRTGAQAQGAPWP